MKTLTDSQNDVLNFIKHYRDKTGTSPSYREIQRHFRYKSIKAVQDHIHALTTKGALERSEPKKRRARQILPTGEKLEGARRIPVYGEIAAGTPRDAPQVELGSVFIADSLTKKDCFGLRVTGNSMVEAGIFEGDFLIVEKGPRVNDGDIAVALLDGETTVKRYKLQNGKPWLVPENSEMKPMEVEGRKFEIQGRVVGLQRRY